MFKFEHSVVRNVKICNDHVYLGVPFYIICYGRKILLL